MNSTEQLDLAIARFEESVNPLACPYETLVGDFSETRVLKVVPCSEMKPTTLTSWERLPGGRVAGIVFNHPKFSDGTHIRTSSVAVWGEFAFITQNRTYLLREPRCNL